MAIRVQLTGDEITALLLAIDEACAGWEDNGDDFAIELASAKSVAKKLRNARARQNEGGGEK